MAGTENNNLTGFATDAPSNAGFHDLANNCRSFRLNVSSSRQSSNGPRRPSSTLSQHPLILVGALHAQANDINRLRSRVDVDFVDGASAISVLLAICIDVNSY
jgi:hypothetical protein